MTRICIEPWSGDKHTGTRATMQRAVVEREGKIHEIASDLQPDSRPEGVPGSTNDESDDR